MPGADAVSQALTDCFDQHYRSMWVVLTRRFGPTLVDDIEEALQVAAERALNRWPDDGIPDHAPGWLVTTARNHLLDRLRHRSVAEHYAAEQSVDAAVEGDLWEEPLEDDVVRMMLVCAHPDLTARESTVITMRIICNLSVPEIARGLLSTEAAVKKQLTRAKARIRDLNMSFEAPAGDALEARIDRVLQCIYLLFNEGYLALRGENLVRQDLCREAQRLVELLLASDITSKGKVWALAALLAFQASRAGARVDADGQLVRLADQSRAAWDTQQIAFGMQCLARAMGSQVRSRYHLEAGIAACHAAAPDYESTDWVQIREYYDDLASLVPSPIVDLNRAVAICMTDGAEAAISCLEHLESAGELSDNYLLYALLGDFHVKLGDLDRARRYYRQAHALVHSEPVHDFLLGQLEQLNVQHR